MKKQNKKINYFQKQKGAKFKNIKLKIEEDSFEPN